MRLPIKSVVAEMHWPALPSSVATSRLAALFQLEQSQWWPQEKLREQQFLQANALLRYSAKNVPYYQKLLSDTLKTEPVNEAQWRNIPLLTRDKLQQAGDKLYTKTLPPSHGKVNMQRTSGSTGRPVESLGSDITRFFWNVFTLRDHLWHRRDFAGKLAVIRHSQNKNAKPPGGIISTNWGPATAGLIETGPTALINIHTPLAEQATWLQNENPDYLLTHPSILQELAIQAQQGRFQLPGIREVRTLSEALPDGLREVCRQVWGVKLVDIYSSIEAGYLALQCPEHEHYHVQSENVLLEVLDDDGAPCTPGQVGKVVITSLNNFAMPLIRYELGDYAEVGEPCSCGRGLPVIKHILGRYRNLITLPTGERIWPKFGMADILKVAPVRQFQAVQTTLHDIEFKLVLERPLIEEDRLKTIELFRANLHPSMNVTIREVEQIARSKSGKYEDFVSNL